MYVVIRRFWSLSGEEKSALLEALYYLLWARVMNKLFSFEKLMPHIGTLTQSEPKDLNARQQQQVFVVKRSIQRTHSRFFWQNICLPQALAAMKMLHRRQVPAQIYFGSAYQEARKNLKAHAWVKAGTIFVSGKKGHQNYTVVSVFSHDERL